MREMGDVWYLASLNYARTYHLAHKKPTLENRKAFIRAEVALGWAALAVYEAHEKTPKGRTRGDAKGKKKKSTRRLA
jgi:hypothetical protein